MTTRTRTMDHQVLAFSLKYLEDVGGKKAEEISSQLLAQDYHAVMQQKVHPASYDDFNTLRCDYLACELLRKYPGFPVEVDTSAAAKQAWWESERQCWVTNRRLYPFCDNTVIADEGVHDFINRVRKKIRSIIGETPPEITDLCSFGPGATYDCRGKEILSADKIRVKPTATSGLFEDVGHIWIFGSTKWGQRVGMEYTPVKGNRWASVPKTSLTDRSIAIEATLNVYIQKGYGQALRKLLKRSGIDLVRGQEIHGELAEIASRNPNWFATIDLSSASDTVSRATVELLLPNAWFKALDSARSRYTYIDEHWVRLEKFSSMGNGFTFELETLIFAAICSCAIEVNVETPPKEEVLGNACFVYGDDIIVPTKFSREVLSVLRWFGFKVNDRKTFITGYFRESCGTDAYDGKRIKPLRLDSVPASPSDWIAIANGVRRSLRDPSDSNSPGSWHFAVKQIPWRYRTLYVPERLGDAGLNHPNWVLELQTGEQLRKKKPRDARFSPGTDWVRALLTVTKPVPWKYWTEDVMLESRLLEIGDYSQGLSGRGCLTDQRVGWVSVS